MTLKDKLLHQIDEKRSWQHGQEAPPDCVLWPDKNRDWQDFIPLLVESGLDILTLGPFDPERKTGPASYLLWSIHHGDHPVPPVLYLPGVGGEELRASDTCKPELQPMAALRYRSTVFAHPNTKDWTLPGWFSSGPGADLHLEETAVAKTMLRSSFKVLLSRDYGELRGTAWTSDNLSGAVVTDPVFCALQWLGSHGVRASVPAEFWAPFCEKAKKDFGFNPEKDSALDVAGRLAECTYKLQELWKRFSENPSHYPGVTDILFLLEAPKEEAGKLFSSSNIRYPLLHKRRHEQLAVDLKKLAAIVDAAALGKGIRSLWNVYRDMEDSLWTEMGRAPLLRLLAQLHGFVESMGDKPQSIEWTVLVDWYASRGYRPDSLALELMSWKDDLAMRQTLLTIVQNLYLPWLETITRIVEQAYQHHPEVFLKPPSGRADPSAESEVVFFVDALRYDLGVALKTRLEGKGLLVELKAGLTVLPSTTATAKPAISPLAPFLSGGDMSTDDAYPRLGGAICNADTLRKGLAERGWTIMKAAAITLPPGKAWLEYSELDTRGHDGSLPEQWSGLLDELVFTIQSIFAAGWKSIHLVTDHGWLLTPQNLPKAVIASAIVRSKGGRAAILYPDSAYPNLAVPWYWDPMQNFNLAPGISTFYQSNYAHGGLSFQEVVVPILQVRSGITGHALSPTSVDASLTWKGLRLRIGMDSHPASWTVDLRLSAGDPATSLIGGTKSLAPSIVVEEPEYQGTIANFIIMNESGTIVFQKTTTIGL